MAGIVIRKAGNRGILTQRLKLSVRGVRYTGASLDRGTVLVKKLIALFVVVLILVGAGWIAFEADYSEGYRVGQIIKLSHKGYIFKTWEGTLDFGYLQQDPTGGVATRLWDFSVRDSDEQVRKDIDTAIAANAKVKLYYRERYFRWPWLGDTKHFVFKVERAG